MGSGRKKMEGVERYANGKIKRYKPRPKEPVNPETQRLNAPPGSVIMHRIGTRTRAENDFYDRKTEYLRRVHEAVGEGGLIEFLKLSPGERDTRAGNYGIPPLLDIEV